MPFVNFHLPFVFLRVLSELAAVSAVIPYHRVLSYHQQQITVIDKYLSVHSLIFPFPLPLLPTSLFLPNPAKSLLVHSLNPNPATGFYERCK